MEEKKEPVLGETYEKGKPEGSFKWRKNLETREEMLLYLRSGERYWYSGEWFGSEKRKNPA